MLLEVSLAIFLFKITTFLYVYVSFHSKCKVWEQRPDTVRQFKEPCQCGVPRIF